MMCPKKSTYEYIEIEYKEPVRSLEKLGFFFHFLLSFQFYILLYQFISD